VNRGGGVHRFRALATGKRRASDETECKRRIAAETGELRRTRKRPLERSYDLEAKSQKTTAKPRLVTGRAVGFHCCDVSRTRSVADSFFSRRRALCPPPTLERIPICWGVSTLHQKKLTNRKTGEKYRCSRCSYRWSRGSVGSRPAIRPPPRCSRANDTVLPSEASHQAISAAGTASSAA